MINFFKIFQTLTRWFGLSVGKKTIKNFVSIIKKFSNKKSSEELLFRQLSKKPELLVELKKSVDDLKANIAKFEHLDRNGARKCYVNRVKSGEKGFRATIMVVTAVVGLILCFSFISVYFILYKASPSIEILLITYTVANVFANCLQDAYGFEFGASSRSSLLNDKVVEILLKRLESKR